MPQIQKERERETTRSLGCHDINPTGWSQAAAATAQEEEVGDKLAKKKRMKVAPEPQSRRMRGRNFNKVWILRRN